MDGTSNNKDHVFWGAAQEDVARDAPAMYADGIVMPAGANRPSPRKISNELFQQVRYKYTGLDKIRSVLVVFKITLTLSHLLEGMGRRMVDTDWVRSKVKSASEPSGPSGSVFISGFCGVKRLRVFLLPP